jgi:hypothetical protein
MTVTAPPEVPPPSYDELEALIEEARRRARRRRLLIAGGTVVAALAAGGILAALLWPGGKSASGGDLLEGLHAVQAQGPVRHALVEQLLPRKTTIALDTGRGRPTRQINELWWDARSGLSRMLAREDGVVVADLVQRNCFGVGRGQMCLAPSPFDLLSRGVAWQPRSKIAKRVGTGTFRGHRVLWVEQLVVPERKPPYLSGSQAAFDVITHRLVGLQQRIRHPDGSGGPLYDKSAITMLPDLPAKKVSFAVPDGGAPRNLGDGVWDVSHKVTLARAADLLGRPPLWLDRSYRGHRLRVVQAGVLGGVNAKGARVGTVPLVRLDYGTFEIDEVGSKRSIWLKGTKPGTLVSDRVNSYFTFGRDGVAVQVVLGGAADKAPSDLVALARSLRPAA